jgi:DNA replication protein DnaC
VYEGFECLRISFDDFCVLLRSAMSVAASPPGRARLTEWDIIEPLKCVNKLFIDDLGLRGKPESGFAYTTLYSILNKRQERLLATFISSNKDIERLELAFNSRIASRLRAAIIIEMKGQDRRRQRTEDRGRKSSIRSIHG